ncbi:hypothetical protein ACIHFC_10780 [Streptomyces sp. NPDC052013]|uniref:hypothetical protein n=1 Tax=Streptomyces sp. NPDC052013 TaxID=3365679 RepID=UPI0037D62AAF
MTAAGAEDTARPDAAPAWQARILDPAGAPLAVAAVLVAERTLLTCAAVLDRAPAGVVLAEFHGDGRTRGVPARIAPTGPRHSLAVLHLERAPAAVPAPLGRCGGRIGFTVSVYVDSHSLDALPPDRRLTVTAKREVMVLPVHANAKTKYDVKIPYVVELRTTNRALVYAGALTFDTKALSALDPKTGWLGLSEEDARWFYTRVRVGHEIEITSTAPPGGGVVPSKGAGAPSGSVGVPSAAP